MGGNLLKPYGAQRIDRVRYDEVVKEVLGAFKTENVHIRDIPNYRNKETFGDIDFVYSPFSGRREVYEELLNDSLPVRVLKANVFSINGNITSLLYREVQLDFILTEPVYFATAYEYYSYNDLGNLLGKIFRAYGLKFGHKGLMYPVMHGTHKITEIRVTDRMRETLRMLRLDYEVYEAGFNNLSDIFDFVCSSPLFHPSIFALENLNSENKRRDRKRSTYMNFLRYIGVSPNEDGIIKPEISDSGIWQLPPKEEDLEQATYDVLITTSLGNSALAEADDELAIYLWTLIERHFINGKVVSEAATGLGVPLQGKALGAFLKAKRFDLSTALRTSLSDYLHVNFLSDIPIEAVQLAQIEMKAAVERAIRSYLRDHTGPTFLV